MKKVKLKSETGKLSQQPVKSSNLFPVVGIGASAGGLDAFKKLLKAIPEDSGMAYVLVQHLDPKHESLLPELLQKVTKIPVLEITDDIKVHPDHIYVIPSNKMMVATDGVLLLAPRPEKSNTVRNLPIDLFFTSLAEVHQEHAIGVVLSGTASDGTQGLKAIKEHGGITFAQDEASAEYEGMPHSAAEAGVVDFILPPGDIPKKLLEVTSKIKLSDEELQNIPKQDEDIFKQILSLLRIRKGVDFTYYKQTTIRRRILRRMVVNKNEEPGDYLKFLRGSTAEQDLLYQDMLIPVTSFFRDKKVFEDLCNNVFPTILKNKIPGEITRIWVAGCSTGQEAYSFAICFKEFLGDDHERIQIFGTDLSEPAITKARTGIYEKNELDAVSAERLKEHFTKNNGGYQVNKIIRDMCVFAHHNFLKDPPFGKMDCISCRNVLIYMEPYLQKKALTTFHYALNPKGFLLLGKSETTSGVPDLFAAVQKSDKLYTRKDVPGRFMQVASQRSEQILNQAPDISKGETIRTDFQKTADDILLTKYTPAGVVVNEAMDIVHFRGNTANYLEQAPGKPSHNLLMMAKAGLGFELRNILHKAKAEKIPVVKDNIPLSVNGQLLNICIEAVPLPNTLEPYYLVLFHDKNLTDTDGLVTGNRKKVSPKTKQDEKDIQIQLLEQELAQAREDMRSITEDQEASNEELQSANEELLSSSEELQSLNEELETSKEELQSTNEELTVLNHELTNLNEQVTDAKSYSESIVATLYQPQLVLDKNLRVKTANQAFYKTFHVNEQETEGVLIYDLGNRQWNIPELRTLLEEILPQKKQITDYEVTHNFLDIGERIILLSALEITREKKDEKLILLSIEDVTERKHALKKLEESEAFNKSILENSPDCVKIIDSNGRLQFMNSNGLHIMEIDDFNQVKNKGWAELWGHENRNEIIKAINTALDGKTAQFQAFCPTVKGKPKWWDVIVSPVTNPGTDKVTNIVSVSRDVTAQREFQLLLEYRKALLEAHNEASIDGILLVDAKGKILSYNKRFIEIWQMPQYIVDAKDDEAALNYAMTQLINPNQFIEKVKYLYQNPTETNIDILDFKDGKIIERHGYPVVAADGTYFGWSWTFRDITIQKLAEIRIKQSESELLKTTEHFEIATTAAEVGIWSLDIATEILIWSALHKKMWGYDPNRTDLHYEDWHKIILASDKEQAFASVEKAQKTRSAYEAIYRIKRPDNEEIRWIRSIGQYFYNDAGVAITLTGVSMDITEQKQAQMALQESEEHFRQLANMIPDKITTSDATGIVNYYNQNWVDFTGRSFKNLINEGWDKSFHPDELEELKKKWQHSIESGNDLETEVQILDKSGVYKWHLTRASAVKDEDGKVMKWIGCMTEIQKIKEEEQRKDDFLKMVSHELKTPVTSVKGYVQLLLHILKEKQETPAAFFEAPLLRIDSQVGRLSRLIAEMLDLSRLDTGKLEMVKEKFNLEELVSETIQDIGFTNNSHTLNFTKKCNATIMGDRSRIGQVIINLLNNAIKYSPENGSVDISMSQSGGDNVAVTVTDHGIGIDKEDQHRIFERFYRVGGLSEKNYAGFGIGLFIASEIIERHGGTITVDSEKNKGAAFTFILPLA